MGVCIEGFAGRLERRPATNPAVLRIAGSQTAQGWQGISSSLSDSWGKRDSLAIDGETGTWFCHSGCARGGSIFDFEAELAGSDGKTARAEVLRIVGRASENGTAKKRISVAPASGHIVCAYDYTDEAGNLLFQCVRYAPKDFSQRRPDCSGGWIGNLKGVRRVLYRLPAVIAAQIVFIVEGEKDADALTALATRRT